MAVSLASGVDNPALLALLADGRVHSGAWLARELEASLSAVRQGILRLRSLGIDVKSQARRGYYLPQPIELLDALLIRAALEQDGQLKLRNLEVLFEVDSTNTRLLEAAPPPAATTTTNSKSAAPATGAAPSATGARSTATAASGRVATTATPAAAATPAAKAAKPSPRRRLSKPKTPPPSVSASGARPARP